MTTQKNTTPRTTPTKPVLTVKADGAVVCNCPSYRAAAAMFGEGFCSHVSQARMASAKGV
jgi:hypothetical protein